MIDSDDLLECDRRSHWTGCTDVNSHTGDAFREALLDPAGAESLALKFDNQGETSGFPLPHQGRYFDTDRVMATDRFEQIVVVLKPDDTEETPAETQGS